MSRVSICAAGASTGSTAGTTAAVANVARARVKTVEKRILVVELSCEFEELELRILSWAVSSDIYSPARCNCAHGPGESKFSSDKV